MEIKVVNGNFLVRWAKGGVKPELAQKANVAEAVAKQSGDHVALGQLRSAADAASGRTIPRWKPIFEMVTAGASGPAALGMLLLGYPVAVAAAAMVVMGVPTAATWAAKAYADRALSRQADRIIVPAAQSTVRPA